MPLHPQATAGPGTRGPKQGELPPRAEASVGLSLRLVETSCAQLLCGFPGAGSEVFRWLKVDDCIEKLGFGL